MTHRKWYFLQPDGAADEPLEALGGRTPLAAAHTPNLDRLAAEGEGVDLRTIPEGYPPGSDVGNLSLLGYDPRRTFTGRSPIEAAALGIALQPTDIAMRCNLVHVAERDGHREMVDFSADHIETEQAAELIAAVGEVLEGARLYPGVSYRHTLVTLVDIDGMSTTPPHDIQGQAIEPHLPRGGDAARLRDWMDAARPVLAAHPVNQARIAAGRLPATDIWLWGQGRSTTLQPFVERHEGLRGSMITAVDLARGLAALSGMQILDVPGVTGFIDTNFAGKADAAIAVTDGLVFLHLEAPDETSHMGRLDLKIESLERFDREIVGPVIEAALAEGAGILVSPDHPTLIRTRTHALANVPALIWTAGGHRNGFSAYSEAIVGRGRGLDGWEFIDVARRERA